MRRIVIMGLAALLLANNGGCNVPDTDPAAASQANTTRQTMNNGNKIVGMPNIVNFAQRLFYKHAYEDMDKTVITWAYSKGMDGKFTCIGQALGYGISMGTQMTAPRYPQHIVMPQSENVTEMMEQPEPNGLYMPSTGAATLVNLIDPKTKLAHTSVFEDNINTVPFEMSGPAVEVPCGAAIDPATVVDSHEQDQVKQHN